MKARRPLRRVHPVIALACFGVAAAASAARAADEAPPAGHAVPGWYLGMPVLLHGAPPPEGVDRKTLPQFRVYVHAPVSATAGAAPMKTVTRPDGQQVTLPPHQDTLEAMHSAAAPRLGVGYFVIGGPKATDANTRVQPQPEKSWPRSPLVAEIRIGPEWVKVNSHVVIEHGIQTGLLELQFFDVGGMMWGEYMDPDAREIGELNCTRANPLPAPAIDWINDRDYRPGTSP